MQKIFENWRRFLKEQDDVAPPEEKVDEPQKRKRSGEIFKPTRNQEVPFDPEADPDLKYELYDLIANAYAEIGGHAKIKGPDSVTADKDWDVWVGMDIHNDPDFDLISFGSTTPFGMKFSGVGHDGTQDAKEIYKRLRTRDLNMDGNYMEASGKLARALIKAGVPIINDEKTVEKVLRKKVKWIGRNIADEKALGDGWYIRNIGGEDHEKIMLGKPGL